MYTLRNRVHVRNTHTISIVWFFKDNLNITEGFRVRGGGRVRVIAFLLFGRLISSWAHRRFPLAVPQPPLDFGPSLYRH